MAGFGNLWAIITLKVQLLDRSLFTLLYFFFQTQNQFNTYKVFYNNIGYHHLTHGQVYRQKKSFLVTGGLYMHRKWENTIHDKLWMLIWVASLSKVDRTQAVDAAFGVNDYFLVSLVDSGEIVTERQVLSLSQRSICEKSSCTAQQPA